jgi:hypothetical protein
LYFVRSRRANTLPPGAGMLVAPLARHRGSFKPWKTLSLE